MLSEARADSLRLQIEQACGGLLAYVDRDRLDMQDAIASRLGRGGAPKRSSSGLPPDVENQILLEFMERHYATWPDVCLVASLDAH